MKGNYSAINNITGWIVFLVSSAVYLLTIEPTTSFWDCGEFISAAYKLEVGHPPGAPFYLMMGRLFSLFASDPSFAAMWVNIMSAIASSTTILFLFWTITHLAKKAFDEQTLSPVNTAVIMASGAIGALAFTFSDTFWFSAVEGEVYAMSSLFTAVVFWAILKWEDMADDEHNEKWLVLISYLMGLSIGVHLLNLLAIPAIGFVYYFRKFDVSRKGIIATLAISVATLAFVLWGIIQGSVKVASKVELFAVNTLGMPFNAGLLIYLAILLAALSASLYLSHKEGKVTANAILATVAATLMGLPFVSSNPLFVIIIMAAIGGGAYLLALKYKQVLNLIMLCGTVIILGYSSYAMIVLRSLANPPMDENNPENVFSLLSYLNRDQYGDTPLLYGAVYNAPLDSRNPYSDGKKTYTQRDGKYIVSNIGIEHNYDDRFTVFFPRMHSSSSHHVQAYKDWANIKGTRIMVDGKEYIKPTTFENIKFFFSYQLNHMYWRYFMWNFAGRQNDEQGHGDILNGNWISGINFLDNMRLGDQSMITETAKNHPARNTYYFLPLLLGLAGAIYSFLHRGKEFTIVALLFFLTGLAIVLYLNQSPYQPRERDYAYAGSFYAFAIWIGIGVLAIYRWLEKYLPAKACLAAAVAITVPVPAILAAQNWDDHDRSGRYTTRDFAYNYLVNLKPNALIFTNGDNDTFPLWFAQEVEGIRTDVRVVCLPLLSTDWYGDQMKKATYESAPLPIKIAEEKYVQGTRDYLPIIERLNKRASAAQIMEFISSDAQSTKVPMGNNTMMDFIPTRDVFINMDTNAILANKAAKPEDIHLVKSEIEWKLKESYILKNEMFILDILSNYDWSRPMYFTSIGTREMLGLDDYFVNEGFVYRFSPINQRETGRGSDPDLMYENLMEKYLYGRMEHDDVHLCHFNLRTLKVIGMRDMFAECAKGLLRMGRRDSAVAVLNRAVELMPHPKVPHDFFSYGIAEAYYRANEAEKANFLVKQYADECIAEIRFFSSLDLSKRMSVRQDEQRSLAIAARLIQLAQINGQQELAKEIQDRLSLYAAI
jgi:hypothetical protein